MSTSISDEIKRRDRHDIVVEILRTAVDGKIKTHIMYKAKLSYAQLNEYLPLLVEKGFLEVHTPRIIGSATEGGAELFQLDYFDRKAYLAQSPQLYKEELVMSLEKVFEIGPFFRAEESHTRHHLSEFVSIDGYQIAGAVRSHLAVNQIRTREFNQTQSRLSLNSAQIIPNQPVFNQPGIIFGPKAIPGDDLHQELELLHAWRPARPHLNSDQIQP
jgi:predicted transcriptional regulator